MISWSWRCLRCDQENKRLLKLVDESFGDWWVKSVCRNLLAAVFSKENFHWPLIRHLLRTTSINRVANVKSCQDGSLRFNFSIRERPLLELSNRQMIGAQQTQIRKTSIMLLTTTVSRNRRHVWTNICQSPTFRASTSTQHRPKSSKWNTFGKWIKSRLTCLFGACLGSTGLTDAVDKFVLTLEQTVSFDDQRERYFFPETQWSNFASPNYNRLKLMTPWGQMVTNSESL